MEDKIKASEERPGDGKLTEKAREAKQLLGKLVNVHFLLRLSGCSDIYGQYGKIVNVAQIVNLLPHERYDKFMAEVEILHDMEACIYDHEKCTRDVDRKCLFPLLHNDRKSLKDMGKIQGVVIVNQAPVAAAGLERSTRNMVKEANTLQNDPTEKHVEDKLKVLLTTLYAGLKNEVFDDDAKNAISYTKTALDLPALAIKMKSDDGGYVKVSLTEFPAFIRAVRCLPIRSLDNIGDDDLKVQFREFVKRLEKVTKQFSVSDLRNADPKKIIKVFFDPTEKLFDGIEIILQAISVCCVKVSCESVLESLVSIFENHFHARRNMHETSTSEEFMIAGNGPNLASSDAVVKEAMTSYWRSKKCEWHFYRKGRLDKLTEFESGSQVIDRMIKKQSRLPFMDT